MSPFYTRKGDDGSTGLLGQSRVLKSDLRMEVIGSLDEASAALGLSRSLVTQSQNAEIIFQIQTDLYKIMAEIAAEADYVERFRSISDQQVGWLEEKIDHISQLIQIPKDFIIPGDTPAAGALSLARTIVRRAERRMVESKEAKIIDNQNLFTYINRLSSLIFVMEIYEIKTGSDKKPSLAKRR